MKEFSENILKPKIGDQNESKETLEIKWASSTVASEHHPERNEDAYIADSEIMLFGVLDGVGGRNGGDVAAGLAVRAILEHLRDNHQKHSSLAELKALFEEAYLGANSDIMRKQVAQPDIAKMGTTATTVKIDTDEKGNPFAVVCSIGDSRAYLYGSNGLEQITVDDDAINNSNTLTADQKMHYSQVVANASKMSDLEQGMKYFFEHRNRISKYLGYKLDSTPRTYVVPLGEGDRLLLTTDGIHDNLTTDEIMHILKSSRTAKEASTRLKDRAVEISRQSQEEDFRAKPDDMTNVIIEIKKR